jgi:hypothetical protein
MLLLAPVSVVLTLLLIVSSTSLSNISQLHLSVISFRYISSLHLSVTSFRCISRIVQFLLKRLLLASPMSLSAYCSSSVASCASFSHFSHLSQLHLVFLVVSSSSSFTCFFNLCQSLFEHLSLASNLIICLLSFFYLPYTSLSLHPCTTSSCFSQRFQLRLVSL